MPVTISGDGTLTGVDSVASGLGKILQVVQSVNTSFQSTSSTSYVDITGLSVSITPQSASSKILAIAAIAATTGYASARPIYGLVRTSTVIASQRFGSAANDLLASTSLVYLDSPATTSATTYKVQFKVETSGTVYIDGNTSSLTLIEVAA